VEIDGDRIKSLEEQNIRIRENLVKIRYRIVIFSGKGGVGKTTVAVNLAYALMKQNLRIGILDADITGPNVPQMLGLQGQPGTTEDRKIIPQTKDGLRVISIAPMIPADQPVIWRGPLRSGTIAQFLADVVWDELDILLADLPPGTGDEVLTTAQKMLPQMAIIVTTPQEVSLIDCKRAVNMAKRLNIGQICVIENMAGLICPHCEQEINFFGMGGGETMAEDMNICFLGRIPMEQNNRECGDAGIPIFRKYPDSKTAGSFYEIAQKVYQLLN
jgi:ATP-binding protein involved in chromosome partitioning